MNINCRLFHVSCISLLLLSCDDPPAPHASESALISSLNNYASDLVKSYPLELLGHDPAYKWSDSMPLYRVVFKTDNPSMLTKEVSAGDDAGYEYNITITRLWQDMFCTAKLESIMRQHNISFVDGTIADVSGGSHSRAGCGAPD